MSKIRLVIFDLDGTLLDTLADLAAATNYALQQVGLPVHAVEAYRQFIGHGIYHLFEQASGVKDAVLLGQIHDHFKSYYTEHATKLTKPYAGVRSLIDALQERGIAVAIASNKYQAGVDVLVAHFFADIHFVQVWGQREGYAKKPDPTVVNEILSLKQTPKDACLYVGDMEVDLQTAAAAGVAGIGVTWGFRSESFLREYPHSSLIGSPEELLALLG